MKAKKIIQFAIGPIFAAVLGFTTLPLVAWFFSVEDIGRLTMLQVSISFSVMFFSLAMNQGYVREYHEENDKPKLLKMAILPGFLLLIIILPVILAISILNSISISKIVFGINSSLITFLFFVSIISAFFINFLSHVLRMQERGIAFSATQVIPRALLLIFIGIIILLNLKNEFQNLLLANTGAIIISLLTFAWITKDSWLLSITVNIDKKLLKKLLKFSLPLVIGGFAYWGLTTMDRFFLRAFSSFEEMGIYAISVSLAGAVSVFSTIFSSLWHPLVYKWVKEGVNPEKVQSVIENMFLAVALLWTIVGLFSWLIIYLLPDKYSSVEYLLIACVGMPLFYMLSETTVVGVGITRKSSYAMLASIVAFFVNGILNYLLIPSYGASGAAISSLIAFFAFFLVRTEASAYLWVSIPRFKIYTLLLFYLIATTVHVFSKAQIDYFFLVWLFLIFLSFSLFSKRLAKSYVLLKYYKTQGVKNAVYKC